MTKAKLRTNATLRDRTYSDKYSLSFEGLDPKTNARTQQSFGRECDINTIFAKYRATGLVRVPSRARDGFYGDLPSSSDLHSALNLTYDAESKFQQLPADMRKRFNNDYTQMYAYLNDPSKMEESYTIGLRKKPVDASAPAAATPPAAPPSEPPKAPSGAV